MGSLGAVLVILAAALDSRGSFLVGTTLLGGGNASLFLGRYAAAETADPDARGRALGRVFLATAVGAVLSPMLLAPSGVVAAGLGLPRLVGLYLVAAAVFAISAIVVARSLPAAAAPAPVAAGPAGGASWLLGALPTPARLALGVLGGANAVMVAMMSVVPVAMHEHGRSLGLTGSVVALHVTAMFAPSPVTGRLIDGRGAAPVAALGLALLALAAVLTAVVGEDDVRLTTLALVVLGLGWNVAVLGGSALLAATVAAPVRPHAEALGEVAMGAAAGAGAPLAGLLASSAGAGTFAVVAAGVAVAVLATLVVGSPTPALIRAARPGPAPSTPDPEEPA